MKALAHYVAWAIVLTTISCGPSKKSDEPSHGNDGIALFKGNIETACGDDVDAVKREISLAPAIKSESGNKHLRWVWCDQPTAEQFVRARLQIFDVAGVADQLVVDPQMPSMGHGTYVDEQVVAVVDAAVGIVDVSGIYFIMGGDWDVYVSISGERFTVPVVVAGGVH